MVVSVVLVREEGNAQFLVYYISHSMKKLGTSALRSWPLPFW